MAELGLDRTKVRLVAHSRDWAGLFLCEKRLIEGVMGADLRDVQHIGSTAIPCIQAKPMVDICGGVDDLGVAEASIEPLKSIDYEYADDIEIEGHRVFIKGQPRSYVLHLVVYRGERWNAMIGFRDALIRDGGLANEYEQLKKDLAAKHPNDRPKYTGGKAEFIDRVVREHC